MKGFRYIVVVLLVLTAREVFAWSDAANKAILMLAEENLSRQAKREVAEVLGAPLYAIEFDKDDKHTTRLDEGGRSVTTSEKDAVVLLEKSIATLKEKGVTAAERKEALRSVAEMMVAIHNPANIRIDKYLEKEFSFGVDNDLPKDSWLHKVSKMSWQKMWNVQIDRTERSFSAEMYLYDWHIATKGMAKQYKSEEVAPRKWAEHTAAKVLPLLGTFKADGVVSNLEIIKLEEKNNHCRYDAAFRLAVLLNDIFK